MNNRISRIIVAGLVAFLSLATYGQSKSFNVERQSANRFSIPFGSPGSANISNSVSGQINLASYSLDPSQYSQEVGSIDLNSSIGISKLRENASVAHIVSFDTRSLAQIEPYGIVSSGPVYHFASQDLRPVIRRQSRIGSEVYLTFISQDTSDMVVLVVNEERDTVSGWRDLNGRRSLIVPARNTDQTLAAGTSLLVETTQGSYEQGVFNDSGDVRREDHEADYTGSSGEASTDDDSTGPSDCDTTDDVLAEPPPALMLDKELTIYAAYTQKSVEKANQNDDEHWLHPYILIESQAGSIQTTFEKAGVFVTVPTPFVEESSFVEPANDSEMSLKEIVHALASSNDPAFVEFRQRRAELLGDIGILVVHRDSITDCGYVVGVAAPAEQAFAVVNWQCIASAFSYLHEIGHILGGNHRTVSDANREPRYARAFRSSAGKVPFVTVMGSTTNCGALNCARVPQFSNHYRQYAGQRMGNSCDANNERAIRQGIQTAVGFGETYNGMAANLGLIIDDDAGDVWIEPTADSAGAADDRALDKRKNRLAEVEDKFADNRCRRRASNVCTALALQLFNASESVLEARIATKEFAYTIQPSPGLSSRWTFTAQSNDLMTGSSRNDLRLRTRFNNIFDDYFETIQSEVSPMLGQLSEENRTVLANFYLQRLRMEASPFNVPRRSGQQFERD